MDHSSSSLTANSRTWTWSTRCLESKWSNCTPLSECVRDLSILGYVQMLVFFLTVCHGCLIFHFKIHYLPHKMFWFSYFVSFACKVLALWHLTVKCFEIPQFKLKFKSLLEGDFQHFSFSCRVIDGLETLDELEKLPVNEKTYRPLNDVRIKDITIHANPFAL